MTAGDVVAALEPVVGAFIALGVRYRIGGSVASSVLGVPRSTIDADVVCELGGVHVDGFVEALADRRVGGRRGPRLHDGRGHRAPQGSGRPTSVSATSSSGRSLSRHDQSRRAVLPARDSQAPCGQSAAEDLPHADLDVWKRGDDESISWIACTPSRARPGGHLTFLLKLHARGGARYLRQFHDTMSK